MTGLPLGRTEQGTPLIAVVEVIVRCLLAYPSFPDCLLKVLLLDVVLQVLCYSVLWLVDLMK